MSHIIYFADKSVIFAKKGEFAPEAHTYVISNELREPMIAAKVIHLFEKYNNILFICDDVERSASFFASQFREVTAAGGVVESPFGEILMIERFERWDLPKGHLEQGESLEQCSLREVREETGVEALTLGDKICVTHHAYQKRGEWELKATHWWAMSVASPQALTPQSEEGITAVEWVKREMVAQYSANSFPTIRTVLRTVGLID